MNYDVLELVRNESKKRFELEVEGVVAFILYRSVNENILDLYHTEVPASLEGKGAGKALVEKTLQYCKTNHLQIIASCPFVAAYILRHPEWKAITV
ncbi:MAG: GNAT family N-acetyltransferase [Ferruginibacter sp.]